MVTAIIVPGVMGPAPPSGASAPGGMPGSPDAAAGFSAIISALLSRLGRPGGEPMPLPHGTELAAQLATVPDAGTPESLTADRLSEAGAPAAEMAAAGPYEALVALMSLLPRAPGSEAGAGSSNAPPGAATTGRGEGAAIALAQNALPAAGLMPGAVPAATRRAGPGGELAAPLSADVPAGIEIRPAPAPELAGSVRRSPSPSGGEPMLAARGESPGTEARPLVDDATRAMLERALEPARGPEVERPGAVRSTDADGASSDRPVPLVTGGAAPVRAEVALDVEQALPVHRPAAMAGRLADTVQRAVMVGDHEVRLALNPPDLGHVDLTIEETPNGLRVVVEASSREARELIQRHLPILHAALESRSLRVDRLDVHQPPLDPGTGGQGGDQAAAGGRHGNGQRGDGHAERGPDWTAPGRREADAVVEERPSSAPIADAGGLDVLA